MNEFRDDPDGGHPTAQQAVLAEADLRLGRQAVYGRAEYARKSPEELALDEATYGDEAFGVGAFTLGAGREVSSTGGLSARLGVQATTYAVPGGLRPLYGRAPVSLRVYLRLSPSRLRAGGHAGGHATHGR
jgi:hypothetical protein